MLYCRKCKINVAGKKSCCPLCHSELNKNGIASDDVYPVLKPQRYSRSFAVKVIGLVSIVAILICFTINYMVSPTTWWSLFVGAGVVCLWITSATAIIQRRYIFKNITTELFFISLLSVLWDLWTGWNRWSLDFVLPIACMVSMLSMVIIAKFTRLRTSDFVIYLTFDAVYGIVPIIFLLTGVLNVIYPSAICVCCSLVSIAALLLFEGKNIFFEFKKKFNF